MKRTPIAAWLWYRGGTFKGYQRQPTAPTVQAALEAALRQAGGASSPVPAGRTDAGVHARMQVVSFRVERGRDPSELEANLERSLPADVGLCVVRASKPFHAGWCADSKRYRYRMSLGSRPPAEWTPYCWDPSTHHRLEGRRPDPERLAALLTLAVGERDFSAFHEPSSVRKTRRLERVEVVPLGEGLHDIRMEGAGFGRYQVRLLVGAATAVAVGAMPEEAYRAALEEAQPLRGLRAPGEGLILWEVCYPPHQDPFTAEERQAPPGLPQSPPFC